MHDLCLSQRTAYDSASGRATKRTDHVAFPDELDMERYAFASQALRAQELERRSREGHTVLSVESIFSFERNRIPFDELKFTIP